jgi:hypothetical protein
MYHGGTNPKGKHSFMNEAGLAYLTYDFQAVLGQYGQARPSFRRLFLLHLFTQSFAHILCPAQTALPPGAEQICPADTDTLRYSIRVNGNSGFVFINNYQDHVDTKPKHNEAVTVRLPEEDISFNNISLAAGESCILPFNLDINNVRIKNATVQPITFFDTGNETYAFFFIPDGMDGVYCFDKDQNITLTAESDNVVIKNNSAACSGEISTFMAESGGKAVRFVTLSRELACKFNVIDVNNQKIAALADAMLLYSNGEFKIQHDSNNADIYVFPDTGIFAGIQVGGTKGIFKGFHLQTAEKTIDIHFREIAANRYLADIPEWDPACFKDVWLQVAYKGDVGRAFINGDMIADNFYNGDIWEIGLREFADRLKNNQLTFYITPIKKEAKIQVSNMAGQMEHVDESIGYIEKIQAKVVYEWRIK